MWNWSKWKDLFVAGLRDLGQLDAGHHEDEHIFFRIRNPDKPLFSNCFFFLGGGVRFKILSVLCVKILNTNMANMDVWKIDFVYCLIKGFMLVFGEVLGMST